MPPGYPLTRSQCPARRSLRPLTLHAPHAGCSRVKWEGLPCDLRLDQIFNSLC